MGAVAQAVRGRRGTPTKLQGRIGRAVRRASAVVMSGGSVVALLVIWFAVTETGLVTGRLLVSPVTVVYQFWVSMVDGYGGVPLWNHVAASLMRSGIGLFLAISVGVPIGLLVGCTRAGSMALGPLLMAFRPVPPIALIPLAVLWFGIGETGKVFLIFLAGFLYVALSTANSVKEVRDVHVRAGRMLGANNWQVFVYVVFPEALPQIVNAVKIGGAISWAVVVAAELVAAQRGLGYMIMDAATFFRIADLYVGIILIGVIGVTIERVIMAFEKRFVHWSGK